jgi:hypothetical protein
LGDVGL